MPCAQVFLFLLNVWISMHTSIIAKTEKHAVALVVVSSRNYQTRIINRSHLVYAYTIHQKWTESNFPSESLFTACYCVCTEYTLVFYIFKFDGIGTNAKIYHFYDQAVYFVWQKSSFIYVVIRRFRSRRIQVGGKWKYRAKLDVTSN